MGFLSNAFLFAALAMQGGEDVPAPVVTPVYFAYDSAGLDPDRPIIMHPGTLEAIGEDFVSFIQNQEGVENFIPSDFIFGRADLGTSDPDTDLRNLGDVIDRLENTFDLDDQETGILIGHIQDQMKELPGDGTGMSTLANMIRPEIDILYYDPVSDPAAFLNGVVKKDLFQADLIPGTAQDYERWAMLHEMAHHGHEKLSREEFKSFIENDADNRASFHYYHAYREGLVSDPEVPYAMQAARAIDTVVSYDSGYRASGVLPVLTPGLSGRGMTDIETDINQSLLKLKLEMGDIVSPEGTSLQERLDTGAAELKQNLPLAYETARDLLGQGAFDDHPAGKALMENFVDGVQRYAPDAFGVAPEDRPKGRPEIVEKLADEYAPIPVPVANPLRSAGASLQKAY